MKPFSYSRWAICIVYFAEKPSLRLASCCSVVVRNGAYGLRRYGLGSTDATGCCRARRAAVRLALHRRDGVLPAAQALGEASRGGLVQVQDLLALEDALGGEVTPL